MCTVHVWWSIIKVFYLLPIASRLFSTCPSGFGRRYRHSGAMSMVRQPIGPTTHWHWSENPLVRRLIGPKKVPLALTLDLVRKPLPPWFEKVCHWPEKCHWSENDTCSDQWVFGPMTHFFESMVFGPMVFGPMGFWTNVPSDQWVFGPMGFRTNGSSDQWAVGPKCHWSENDTCSDQWVFGPMTHFFESMVFGPMVFGPMGFWTNVPSDQWVFGPMGFRTNGSSDQWAVGPSRRPRYSTTSPNFHIRNKYSCKLLCVICSAVN